MNHKIYSLFILYSLFSSGMVLGYPNPSDKTDWKEPIGAGAGEYDARESGTIHKFQVQAGLFIPFSNTQMQIGNEKGNLGTDIDLEDDLGFETQSFAAFGAFDWRISRRSRLSLSYFYLGRSSTYRLEKNIEFRDHTYPVNAEISGFLNTHIGRITYSYAILSKPDYEAGVLIGSHVVDSKMRIALSANIGSVDYEDDFKLTAPLPDIGLFGDWRLNDKLSLHADFSYLPVKVSNVKINIFTYNASVKYQVYHNLGLSLAYTGLNFNINIDGDPLNGYLKWGYQGPSVTATYSFGKTGM